MSNGIRTHHMMISFGAAVFVLCTGSRAAFAQPTYCYDGSIAYGTPCPVPPGYTPAPPPTAAPGKTAVPPTPAPTPALPSAPKLLSLAYVTGMNAVNLTWQAPANPGGSAITQYLATNQVGGVKGNTYRLPATPLKAQLPCAVGSTSCGFFVAAVNAQGTGPASNLITISKTTVK